MESAAASILKRAVEMDNDKQYTMALVLYQEGVRILLDTMKGALIILLNSNLLIFQLSNLNLQLSLIYHL